MVALWFVTVALFPIGALIRAWFRSLRSYERNVRPSTKRGNSSKAGADDATLIDPVELATAN